MPYPLVPIFDTRIRVRDSSADPVLRLRVTEDPGPSPVQGGRPKGCKQLHTNATVATARRLIEQTTLTYKQIETKIGATASTVGRWSREGGWQRHPFAPRASDTVPIARAGRRLKLRVLEKKLQALAERCVNDLWMSPTVDFDRLMQAMQVVKMARLQTMGSRRPRRHIDAPARTGQDWIDRDAAIRTALREMRYGGVKLDHIPEQAMMLLEDAHTPRERDNPAFRARGPRRKK